MNDPTVTVDDFGVVIILYTSSVVAYWQIFMIWGTSGQKHETSSRDSSGT